MQKALAYIGIALLVILGAVTGWWLRGLSIPPLPKPEIKKDTVYIDNPVEIEVTPKGYELVPVGTMEKVSGQIRALEDSLEKKPRIVKKDSLIYIEVPMEQKHYGDSTYDAWVSGYRPSLDSLKLYNTKEIIPVPVYPKPKRWGIGVQVGAGVQYGTIHKQMDVGPYIGVGISYNILSF